MTNRLSSLMAGVALLALAGSAYAGEPMKLSNGQMDKVNAGAISTALANASALALGELLADTATVTATNVVKVGVGQMVAAGSTAQALAAGGVLFNVGAAVQSQAIAIW